MTSIPSGPFTNATPLAAPTSGSSSGSGDLLSDMRSSMDTAFAVGRPVDAEGAGAVLATGGSYIQGATSTLSKLDDGIEKRRRQIEALRASGDTDGAQDQQRQLDMLQKLRDRVQLSIERVSDILAGKDRDDIGGPEEASASSNDDASSRERRRREELDLLQQRQALLAPGIDGVGGVASSGAVASAYAQGGR